MRSYRRSSSLVAAVMGALIVAPIQPLTAQAAPAAKSQNVLSMTSGSILIFATATQTFTNTGAALSTSVSNGVAKNFFVNNGGLLQVSRFVMTITLPNSSNISAFRRCAVNVSFTGSNTCASGSPVALTTPVSGTATNYLISLPGSGYYAFQIVQNKTGTMTVNTSSNLSFVTGRTTHS